MSVHGWSGVSFRFGNMEPTPMDLTDCLFIARVHGDVKMLAANDTLRGGA